MGTIGQNPGTLSFLPKYHEISWLHGFLTTPDHSTCCCQIPYSLVSSHVHTFSPAFALQEAEVPRFITFYHMPGLSPWSLIRNSLQDLDLFGKGSNKTDIGDLWLKRHWPQPRLSTATVRTFPVQVIDMYWENAQPDKNTTFKFPSKCRCLQRKCNDVFSEGKKDIFGGLNIWSLECT